MAAAEKPYVSLETKSEGIGRGRVPPGGMKVILMKLAKHLFLKSSDGRPDDCAWSALWHAYDDLVRRAAYHALAADEERRKAEACADAAKAIADYSIGGRTALSIEQNIMMWMDTHQ